MEAMRAARENGVIVSYDLNYRDSLWKSYGGKKQAQQVNRQIAEYVDVMLGNEEDFSAALGYDVPGVDEQFSNLSTENFTAMIEVVLKDYPFSVVATTLRKATSATRNDWGAICYSDGKFYEATRETRLGNFRPRGRRRFLRVGTDLWISRRQRAAMGRGMWRGARRAGDDDSRRHDDGHAERSGASDERSRRQNRSLIACAVISANPMNKDTALQRALATGIIPVIRAATPEDALFAAEAVLAGGIRRR